jgi:hypothetical protein
MKSLHCHPHPLFLISSFFLLLTSCFPTASIITNTSTDPKPLANYIFVTPNSQPTATPFQPAQTTPLPNLPVVPTLTNTSIPPTVVPQPTDIPTVQPTSVPLDTAAPPPPPPPTSANKPQYAISALMDYAGHLVTVSEAVVYPNRSSDAMSSIAFAVNPNLWNGVFSLQSLTVNDQTTSNYSLAGQWLIVNLDTPLQPGQTVKIGIGYQLTLPYSSSKFENFGYTGRQTNLIDWYPFVPPYSSGNWILPDPYSYGENLVYEKADFRVSLSFADPANAPVVAASAPASFENGVLVYNLPNARNFTLSASPEFLFSTADANGVTIYNYYYPEDATAAANVLELTRLSVITYSTEFGSYPHSTLTVCETDLNDGLETDGLYFLARNFYRAYDGTVRNNLSVIAVHETAHQWWYGAVANNQATEPWLDEALATYSEHVFFEDNYPDLLNWWWNFRVYYYGATGYVDSRVYDTASFRAYVNAVYFNGARFIQSLRDRIGDDAFFAFIHDYYARYNGSIASADDFFAVLNLHTSVDYSDLVTNFFRYR